MPLKYREDSIIFHNDLCMLPCQNNPLQQEKAGVGITLSAGISNEQKWLGFHFLYIYIYRNYKRSKEYPT